MSYVYEQLLGQWAVLAGGDVVVHTCDTEQKAVEYIETVEKMNPNRGND